MGFLTGKTAIITGGGRATLSDGSCGSIGYGIATAYAKEGANLTLTGRNVKKLEDAKEELERLYGIKVLAVQADVSAGADNKAVVEQVIKQTVEELSLIHIYKMTGVIATEITDSFTSLLDAQTGNVADELMKAMDIYEYRDYIPASVSSDSVVGTISEEFAAWSGLAAGTPVIAGALDTSATAVGLGAIHEKDACVILGTTCASEIVMKKTDCKFGAENSRYEKHPIEDLYVELQPTLNGTPNIDWMLENMAQTKDFNEIDRIVESVPVGCGGVVYHPYISVAGERAPFYHPYARASFFGISQVTTRNQLIRAVYEGISLSIRDCLQNIDKDATIYLAGGGAKSPVWAQMIADVMGRRVMIPQGKELGAKGVAIIAGVKFGLYGSYEEAVKKACTFRQTYEPNLQRTKKYDLLYELFRQVRLHNQQIWDYRHQMNKKIQAIKED